MKKKILLFKTILIFFLFFGNLNASSNNYFAEGKNLFNKKNMKNLKYSLKEI